MRGKPAAIYQPFILVTKAHFFSKNAGIHNSCLLGFLASLKNKKTSHFSSFFESLMYLLYTFTQTAVQKSAFMGPQWHFVYNVGREKCTYVFFNIFFGVPHWATWIFLIIKWTRINPSMILNPFLVWSWVETKPK